MHASEVRCHTASSSTCLRCSSASRPASASERRLAASSSCAARCVVCCRCRARLLSAPCCCCRTLSSRRLRASSSSSLARRAVAASSCCCRCRRSAEAYRCCADRDTAILRTQAKLGAQSSWRAMAEGWPAMAEGPALEPNRCQRSANFLNQRRQLDGRRRPALRSFHGRAWLCDVREPNEKSPAADAPQRHQEVRLSSAASRTLAVRPQNGGRPDHVALCELVWRVRLDAGGARIASPPKCRGLAPARCAADVE